MNVPVTPVGWADVATERDLDILESRFDARLATLEVRLTTQISAQTATMIIALVTVVMAVASPVLATGISPELVAGFDDP